ncbi:MAG: aldehyde dehydrogenase family protein [Alphaproteobacteria bacterium]|nr:aldehyde dehydrogenase family protein [Alphaproteobacteria bacterium]
MADLLRTLSPVDGRVLVERPLAGPAALDRLLVTGQRAYAAWRHTPLEQRAAYATRWIEEVVARTPVLAEELTWQMGRPLSQTPGEIAGFADRGHAMIRLATEALADVVPPPKSGFVRHIKREPLGLILVLAPWNYPWLTAVNTIVPAIVAGNVVLLKHSDQTPLVAERLTEAALAAGLPEGVFQHVHMSHELTADAVSDDRIAHVAFTGSVEGGRAVHKAAAGWFKGVGLELGGKDAGYVRADADVDAAIDGLIDGAFYNCGQSCCGIERIYVHRSLYDRFVEGAVATVERYTLTDPTDPSATLGPVVRRRNAEGIVAQVQAAVAAGARALVDPKRFPAASERGLPYLAPQVLVDVTHDMDVMREETFGPVVGIMPVADDEEAVRRINDSPYGLTAAIYAADPEAVLSLGPRLDVGTVFLNRCDYLDPELAWVGVKDSGRGTTLSRLGYDSLTRPKSYHLRLPPSA